MAEYGAEKKISKYSSVVASVSVGQPTGVIMKIKYVNYDFAAKYAKDLKTMLMIRCIRSNAD